MAVSPSERGSGRPAPLVINYQRILSLLGEQMPNTFETTNPSPKRAATAPVIRRRRTRLRHSRSARFHRVLETADRVPRRVSLYHDHHLTRPPRVRLAAVRYRVPPSFSEGRHSCRGSMLAASRARRRRDLERG